MKALLLVLIFLIAFGCDIACDMTYGTSKKTLNSTNAIYNYEYFKEQDEAIKSLKNKAKIAKKDIDTFKKEYDKKSQFDKEELSRLRTIFTGIKYQLSDSIADYNAKSKMVNRNIFKNGLLPKISNLKFND